MTASDRLKAHLEKLEAALDPAWESRKLATWKRALDGEVIEGGFLPRDHRPEPVIDWPKISVNAALRDPELMLLQQLREVYRLAAKRAWHIPGIRCNFGTGILSSVFGAELFLMEEELNTLPTTRPLPAQEIDRILSRGAPEITNGFGAAVFEFAQFFREQIAPYPRIRENVWFVHPDLQGPTDVAELLWGSDLFYALSDEPDRVAALLEIITETYIRFMSRWLKENPSKEGGKYLTHWGLLAKGQVFLRNDSLMNLSRATYERLLRPHDMRILKTFGGGGVHFCGKADHVVSSMTESEGVTLLQVSQPELNDMSKIIAATLGRKVSLCCKYVESMSSYDLSRAFIRE